MTIPITISRKVQTRFKLRAWRAFPREFIGFLVGKRAEYHLEVMDMFFPADPTETPLKAESPLPTTGGRWPWSMRPNRR